MVFVWRKNYKFQLAVFGDNVLDFPEKIEPG